MLDFEFEVLADSIDDKVDGFSMGHISVHGRHNAVTSRGKQPDQSMMIFLSVIELLDGIRRFALDDTISSHEFVGIGSSFRLLVTKGEDDSVRLISNHTVIDGVTLSEMIQGIWRGINIFISLYVPLVDSNDPVFDDLHTVIGEFTNSFGIDASRC